MVSFDDKDGIDGASVETTPTTSDHEKFEGSVSEGSVASNLAERSHAYPIRYGRVTDAFLRLFQTKRYDTEFLDDIATQPSVYDGEQAQYYQPRDDWENIEAFDPAFRWTWREEIMAIRKVDFKVLIWVCFMFFALGKRQSQEQR